MPPRLSRRRLCRALGHTLALGVGTSLVGAARPLRAAEVEATSSLSHDTTRVGEPVRLTMTVRVRGARAPSQLPWPTPLATDFDVSNVSSAGGSSRDLLAGPAAAVYTRTVSAIITPRTEGRFDLGFAVEIEGERIESNAPTLEVLGADADLPTPPAGSEPTEAAGPVFLWATVDKEQAYVGQQITYALDVYERRSFLGVHLRKPPSFTDFFTEELEPGESEIKTVAGRDYRVRPGLLRALFPQRAGTLEIGAAELSLGGRQHISSPAKQIEVKPLPAEGQPPNFPPNNVGNYTISATVDRGTLAANEPVTLQITIEGEGNVKFLDPDPWPQLEGLRRYDPKVETQLHRGRTIGGRRRYEFLLIPEHGGTLTIPPHSVSFFDPVKERYEVVKTKPIELSVEGPAVAQPAEPAPQSDPAGDELAPLVTGETLPRHTPRQRWLTPSRWGYGMLAVPTLAAAAIGGAALWRRFGANEQALARARRQARQRGLFAEAEAAVDSGERFHAAVATVLQELAVREAGPDGVGLPRPELLSLLERRGTSAEALDRLRSLLDECDMARFGAQSSTADERRALLDQVRAFANDNSLAAGGPK